MSDRRIKKLYYSIGEVSQITALQAYVLRFWETEFEELRPKKNRTGNRIYRLEDIKLIFLIKKLLYEEKYTIEGARQRLQALKQKGQQMDLSFDKLRQEDALFEVKKGLRDILALLDHSNHTGDDANRSESQRTSSSTSARAISPSDPSSSAPLKGKPLVGEPLDGNSLQGGTPAA